MAQGPRGEMRPADVIGYAVAVARLSVGDGAEALKVPCGRFGSGQAGAKARVDSTTSERRQKIARKAAGARWG